MSARRKKAKYAVGSSSSSAGDGRVAVKEENFRGENFRVCGLCSQVVDESVELNVSLRGFLAAFLRVSDGGGGGGGGSADLGRKVCADCYRAAIDAKRFQEQCFRAIHRLKTMQLPKSRILGDSDGERKSGDRSIASPASDVAGEAVGRENGEGAGDSAAAAAAAKKNLGPALTTEDVASAAPTSTSKRGRRKPPPPQPPSSAEKTPRKMESSEEPSEAALVEVSPASNASVVIEESTPRKLRRRSSPLFAENTMKRRGRRPKLPNSVVLDKSPAAGGDKRAQLSAVVAATRPAANGGRAGKRRPRADEAMPPRKKRASSSGGVNRSINLPSVVISRELQEAAERFLTSGAIPSAVGGGKRRGGSGGGGGGGAKGNSSPAGDAPPADAEGGVVYTPFQKKVKEAEPAGQAPVAAHTAAVNSEGLGTASCGRTRTMKKIDSFYSDDAEPDSPVRVPAPKTTPPKYTPKKKEPASSKKPFTPTKVESVTRKKKHPDYIPVDTTGDILDDTADDDEEVFPSVGPYQCEICQKITDTKQEFVVHIEQNHHDVVDEEVLISLRKDLRKREKREAAEHRVSSPSSAGGAARPMGKTKSKGPSDDGDGQTSDPDGYEYKPRPSRSRSKPGSHAGSSDAAAAAAADGLDGKLAPPNGGLSPTNAEECKTTKGLANTYERELINGLDGDVVEEAGVQVAGRGGGGASGADERPFGGEDEDQHAADYNSSTWAKIEFI